MCVGRGMPFLLLALWVGALPLDGQATEPQPGASFGLALALSSSQWRDRALNPARHAGWFPSLDVYRESRGGASSSRLYTGLAFSRLSSRFDPSAASLGASLSLGYRRERNLVGRGADLQVSLGGRFEAAYDFAWFENWDDSHLYWLTSYSLGFAGTVTHVLSPTRSVSLEWTVPVAALVSRPRTPILYKTQEPSFGAVLSRMHENLRLTSLHEQRSFDVSLRLKRPHATVGSSLFWRIQYKQVDVSYSREVQILRHSFGATVGG